MRPFLGRHIRLPGGRQRRIDRAHRASVRSGAWDAAARPNLAVRLHLRGGAPKARRLGEGARSIRARGPALLRARARGLPRARQSRARPHSRHRRGRRGPGDPPIPREAAFLRLMHAWNAPVLLSIARRLERLPHALLLHGPQGIGKLALAERVAQLLLCEASASKRPCGACDGCRWFLAGNHPDFRRVEPEALAAQAERAPGEEGEAPARRAKPSNEIKVYQVRTL